MSKKKIKVALLIDEFFGGAGTGFGGYGFLARRGICEHVPNEDIEIEVLLGRNGKRSDPLLKKIVCLFLSSKVVVDRTRLYRLPRLSFFNRLWLRVKNYDMFYSIELTNQHEFILRNEPDKTKKLIFSIQDPRPQYEWDEINTVNLAREPSYYKQSTYDVVHDWAMQFRIPIWNTHAHYIVEKAKDLYNLPEVPEYIYLPNPVGIDYSFDVETYKKKNIVIYLGRLEDVKRGWLFCEAARKLPQYEFHVLGKVNEAKAGKQDTFEKYKNLKNLHLEGHVDGEKKIRFLKDAKVIMISSIHEAVQTAQLEAMSYGTVAVSNLNPDNITSDYGIWIGDVHGDGFDGVDRFVDGIKKVMEDEEFRKKKAKESAEYIRKDRDYDHWKEEVRREIYQVYEARQNERAKGRSERKNGTKKK